MQEWWKWAFVICMVFMVAHADITITIKHKQDGGGTK